MNTNMLFKEMLYDLDTRGDYNNINLPLYLEVFNHFYQCMDLIEKEYFKNIMKELIIKESSLNPLLFLLHFKLKIIINPQFMRKYFFPKILNETNIKFLYNVQLMMSEIYGFKGSRVYQIEILDRYLVNLAEDLTLKECVIKDNILFVVKNFPIDFAYGAHYSLVESFLKSISYNRKNKVHLLIVNNSFRMDILNKNKFQISSEEYFLDKFLQNETLVRNNIYTIDKIDIPFIHQQYKEFNYSNIYFIGGLLDCFNERYLFKTINKMIKTNLILFHENNILDKYIDRLITSHDAYKTEVCKTSVMYYPVNEYWLNLFSYPQRNMNKKNLNIVTVLGGGRIEKSLALLNNKEKKELFRILNDYSIKWYLVGIKNIELLHTFFDNMDNIIIQTSEKHLNKLYTEMDIYFQIPTSEGGGTSMLQAAISGMPVVALFDKAAKSYIPNHLLSNRDNILILLENLINNQNLRLRYQEEELNFIQTTLTIEAINKNIIHIENEDRF